MTISAAVPLPGLPTIRPAGFRHATRNPDQSHVDKSVYLILDIQLSSYIMVVCITLVDKPQRAKIQARNPGLPAKAATVWCRAICPHRAGTRLFAVEPKQMTKGGHTWYAAC